jgi:hypothetical protein
MSLAKAGIIVGILVGLAGFITGLHFHWSQAKKADERGFLEASCQLDLPIAILATTQAKRVYSDAISLAKKLHSGAQEYNFDWENPEFTANDLASKSPSHALVFICPDELDVNVAWSWLDATTKIDDDPFVDVRSGFVTGETPEKVTLFMRRIIEVHEGRQKLRGKAIDNLGANTVVGKTDFQKIAGSFMIPVFEERMGVETISHGVQGFSTDRLSSMDGAGILHFGGHGYPDRIVDTLNGVFVRKLTLAPSIVFNGACYTGVTNRWFDGHSGILNEKTVAPEISFALGMLGNSVVGYLAALHPDHGIPVYQEMEYLAWSGASLGDAIKNTYDGVIIANGGSMPRFPTLKNGMKTSWSPKEIMMRGTSSRVLFGDPSLVPMKAFTPPPFKIEALKRDESTIRLALIPSNLALKATFTNTYDADLSKDNPFNDRAYAVVPLPDEWNTISTVRLEKITVKEKMLNGKLAGFAVEHDKGKNVLHVQIDMPSSGYMVGEFRNENSRIELTIIR